LCAILGQRKRKNEKMKRIFIAIILTVTTYQLYCQVDSIERQILNYDDSKSVIISKGRSLLLDKFLENDKEKVKEIIIVRNKKKYFSENQNPYFSRFP